MKAIFIHQTTTAAINCEVVAKRSAGFLATACLMALAVERESPARFCYKEPFKGKTYRQAQEAPGSLV
jgi:hypothetical protein